MEILNNFYTIKHIGKEYDMKLIKQQLEELFSVNIGETYLDTTEQKQTLRTGIYTSGVKSKFNAYSLHNNNYKGLYDVYLEYHEYILSLLTNKSLKPYKDSTFNIQLDNNQVTIVDTSDLNLGLLTASEKIFDIKNLPTVDSTYSNNENVTMPIDINMFPQYLEFTKCTRIEENVYGYYDNNSDILVLISPSNLKYFKLENWSEVCDFIYPFTKLKYLPDSKLVTIRS